MTKLWKIRGNLLIGVLLAVLCMIYISNISIVSAAENTSGFKALDTVVSSFQNSAITWAKYFQGKALFLFWALAVISLVMQFIPIIFKTSDIGDVFERLIRWVIVIGLFFWFIQMINPESYAGGDGLVQKVVNSFLQMGAQATGLQKAQLTPSGIVGIGLELVSASITSLRSCGWIDGFFLVLAAMLLALVFTLIAANMCILLITAWIQAYAGIIYLGFAALEQTRDITISYLRSLLALGVKILSFTLIVGIGQNVLFDVSRNVMTAKQVFIKGDNEVYTLALIPSVINTDRLNHKELIIVLAISLLILIISKVVPDTVAGLVSGAGGASSMLSAGTVMSTAKTVAGAATGAVGNAAAGASFAANVVRQTAAQSQAGEGLFTGSSGAGASSILGSFSKAKGTNGMIGAASYAARGVGALIANAGSGVAAAAKMGGAKTYMGALNEGVKRNIAQEDNSRAIASSGGTGPMVQKLENASDKQGVGKISGERSKTVAEAPSLVSSVQSAWSGLNSEGVSMIQSIQNAWQSGSVMGSVAAQQEPAQQPPPLSNSATTKSSGNSMNSAYQTHKPVSSEAAPLDSKTMHQSIQNVQHAGNVQNVTSTMQTANHESHSSTTASNEYGNETNKTSFKTHKPIPDELPPKVDKNQ